MPYYFFLWDANAEEHMARNGVSVDDFEAIVTAPHRVGVSRSSGLPAAFGWAADGRYLMCVYELIDDDTVRPVTAYEIQEP